MSVVHWQTQEGKLCGDVQGYCPQDPILEAPHPFAGEESCVAQAHFVLYANSLIGGGIAPKGVLRERERAMVAFLWDTYDDPTSP